MKKFMGDEKPRGKMLSCYYSLSMATLTGLEPAFIVLETTAYPPCSRVYLYWCPWRDSNPHHLASKASASTSWTTRALLERRMGVEPTTTCLASKSSTTELPPRIGVPKGIRTPNLRFRRPMLYPVGLSRHIGGATQIRTGTLRICSPTH